MAAREAANRESRDIIVLIRTREQSEYPLRHTITLGELRVALERFAHLPDGATLCFGASGLALPLTDRRSDPPQPDSD